MTRLGDLAYRAKGAATRILRVGSRRILWTQPVGLGFGNFLYLWLHAHIRQAAGDDYRVFCTDAMRPWVDRFPAIRELIIEQAQVRLIDKRSWGENPRLFQGFGVDFTRGQLQNFVATRLLPSTALEGVPELGVVVNVRRGDYYSVPEYRAQYGFNYQRYLDAAFERFELDGTVTVVSDDPDWCRANLRLPGVVTFVPTGAVEHLRVLCGASTLVGSNSTFSYWGGYVGDVRIPGRRVVMPALHNRRVFGGAAIQLDPAWTAVDLVDWSE